MKQRLLTTVIAIAALSSGVAMAQPDHKGDNKAGGAPQGGQHGGGQGGGQGGHAQGGQGGQGGPGGHGPQGAGGQVHTTQVQTNQVHTTQVQTNQVHTNQVQSNQVHTNQVHTNQVHTNQVFGGQPAGQGHGPQTTGPGHAVPFGGRGPTPTQPFGGPGRPGGRDHGPDGGRFQYRGHQHQAIHRGDYRYPNGWGYRRWNNGQILPFLFLTQSYFFDDYYNYGFGPPPYGYVWVRYGPDLLLVSRRTGRIREVIYGVFY